MRLARVVSLTADWKIDVARRGGKCAHYGEVIKPGLMVKLRSRVQTFQLKTAHSSKNIQ